jgi:hypothetical protein
VVVEAVDPQVEDVEQPHLRPAVLGAEGHRGETVLLHLGRQRLELVQRLRDRVTPVGEQALAVEDGPGELEEGQEVLLAVARRRGLLLRVGVVAAGVGPDVAHVRDQSGVDQRPHPVAGVPHEDVLRGALQIAVDLLLERVVVGGVDGDLDALGLGEGVEGGLPGRLGAGVGRVGPDGHRALAAPLAARRPGVVTAAAAADQRNSREGGQSPEQRAAGQTGCRDTKEGGREMVSHWMNPTRA